MEQKRIKCHENMKMLMVILKLAFRALICCSIFLVFPILVFAQGNSTDWITPYPLSQQILNEDGSFHVFDHPALLAGDSGTVHAFWPTTDSGGRADTLYYAFWDGTTWSDPYDILYVPGQIIWRPHIFAGSNGWVHLLWTDNVGGPAWYSRAPLAEVGSTRSWLQPRLVTSESLPEVGFSMAANTESLVHLVFCGLSSGWINHVSLLPGEEWSAPNPVAPATEIDISSCQVSLAIDEGGRLHVAWGQAEYQTSPVINYANSDDGGNTWSTPLEVDRKDSSFAENYGPTRVSVEVIRNDEVHLVWYGAPSGERWHSWSSDGGLTWWDARQISGSVRGITSPPKLVADASGKLHLITTTLGGGQAHAFWHEGRWSSFKFFDDSIAQDISAVIAADGLLHAAWKNSNFTQIMASVIQTAGPVTMPFVEVPTIMALETPGSMEDATKPTNSLNPVNAFTPTKTAPLEYDVEETEDLDQQTLMMFGLAPVIGFLVLFILLYRRLTKIF